MKATIEWFEQLPEPVRTQAADNCYNLQSSYKSLYETIFSIKDTRDIGLSNDYWALIQDLSKANQFDADPSEGIKAFVNYIQDNLTVWLEFEKRALNAAKNNRSTGAKKIIEELRHDTSLREKGEFKINNNIASCLARVFMILHPEYGGFFRVRGSQFDNENAAA